MGATCLLPSCALTRAPSVVSTKSACRSSVNGSSRSCGVGLPGPPSQVLNTFDRPSTISRSRAGPVAVRRSCLHRSFGPYLDRNPVILASTRRNSVARHCRARDCNPVRERRSARANRQLPRPATGPSAQDSLGWRDGGELVGAGVQRRSGPSAVTPYRAATAGSSADSARPAGG